MTKQEEIAEQIFCWLEEMQKAELSPLIVTQKILKYLREQGVTTRAKCPDCEWSQFGDEMVGMTPCYHCNSTGWITEPIIEGEK